MRTSLISLLFCVFCSSPAFTDPLAFLKRSDPSYSELNMKQVFESIDRTKTSFGKSALEKLLEPISDIETLNQRRSQIMFLIENDQVFSILDNLIEEFKAKHEAYFLHFLTPSERLFFNTNSQFGASKSSMYQLAVQMLTALLVAQGVAYEGYQAYHNFRLVRNAEQRGWFRGFIGYNLVGQVGGIVLATYMITKSIASTLRNIYDADTQVLGFATAYSALAQIEAILKNTHHLDLLAKTQETNANFTALQNNLSERLNARDFAFGRFQWLFSLETYDQIMAYVDDVRVKANIMGRVDAYLSIVRLYREFRAAGVPVTLASFETDSSFGFEFQDLRNLIVPTPVSNDIHIGFDNSSRHTVLTGPHGCGKTTFMKSIAHAYVLAQSILLVPSATARLSPITDIKTYFNITDDITLGLSSFMAEHHQMAKLRTYAGTVSEKEKVLMLIDEPYAKTIQAVGEPRVTSFVRDLISNKNISLVLATHFENPSHLERESNGVVKNFQPEIDANLRPTYKIIPGASDWWFNDEGKRERFIQHFIEGHT